ncbi:DUF4349 domain-containing protein [Microbacterium sp. A93]|uniref:DUF4349 domain-containing protein n=1 Tax=Microbacterium sp. A93 TaxID=3450716 RepID=UPI003F443599
MNDQTPTDTLPEFSQQSIDRIEHAVFAEIGQDRTATATTSASARRKKRRRGWLTGIGVAAAFVTGVLITPPLLDISTTAGSGRGDSSVADGAPSAQVAEITQESALSSAESATSNVVTDAITGATSDSIAREIIANAQATVRVDDIDTAVDAVTAIAEEKGGYVESTDISADPLSSDTSMPEQPRSGYGWIGIRVPSADLTSVIDSLGGLGDVLSSSVSQQDVTSTAIDLRARLAATQASVNRLTELMSQTGSVSELIEAEVALTDRQGQLESYTQQLASLEDQVAMSSLQVELTKQTSASAPEPNAFLDGLLAGWNGFIVSLNALVISVGFLLPWIVIAGAVVIIVWLIRRRHRRRSSQPEIS